MPKVSASNGFRFANALLPARFIFPSPFPRAAEPVFFFLSKVQILSTHQWHTSIEREHITIPPRSWVVADISWTISRSSTSELGGVCDWVHNIYWYSQHHNCWLTHIFQGNWIQFSSLLLVSRLKTFSFLSSAYLWDRREESTGRGKRQFGVKMRRFRSHLDSCCRVIWCNFHMKSTSYVCARVLSAVHKLSHFFSTVSDTLKNLQKMQICRNFDDIFSTFHCFHSPPWEWHTNNLLLFSLLLNNKRNDTIFIFRRSHAASLAAFEKKTEIHIPVESFFEELKIKYDMVNSLCIIICHKCSWQLKILNKRKTNSRGWNLRVWSFLSFRFCAGSERLNRRTRCSRFTIPIAAASAAYNSNIFLKIFRELCSGTNRRLCTMQLPAERENEHREEEARKKFKQ